MFYVNIIAGSLVSFVDRFVFVNVMELACGVCV